MRQILPGIKSIKAVKAKQLPKGIDFKTAAGLPVSIVADFEEVGFVGVPKAELSSDYDRSYYTQTVSVTFKSSVRLRLERSTCFVVTDNNNQSYVIGTHNRPFPQIYEKATKGELDGEGAGFTYEIRYISSRALRECVIY